MDQWLYQWVETSGRDEGKVLHKYVRVQLDDDGPVLVGKPAYWNKKITPGKPGSIWLIDVTKRPDGEGLTAVAVDRRLTSERYVGQWPNSDEVAEWQAQSLAAEHAASKAKAVYKEIGDDQLWELLLPIRQAYHNLGLAGKRQLLALVVEYVTRRVR